MGLLAANTNAVAAHMLYAGDDPHFDILCFKYRALLYMQLEGGVYRLPGNVGSQLADAL